MMITSINTDISYNSHTINYLSHQVTVPSARQDIRAVVEMRLNPDEYETLMQLFRNSYNGAIGGIDYNNIKFANFALNTLTADIIESNRSNEDFLLSLLNGKTSVIVDGNTVDFKYYAKSRLPEFSEKYKLLLNE